jgi:hypothetical protein
MEGIAHTMTSKELWGEHEDVIRGCVIILLYELHTFNKLDKRIVSAISRAFNVDAEEICKKDGITYNV